MRSPALVLVTAVLAALVGCSTAAAPRPSALPGPLLPASTETSSELSTPNAEAVQAQPEDATASPGLEEAEPAAASAPAALPPLGQRAMDIMRALANGIGSRPAGTAAERAAASFLAEQFEAMGYAVEVVPFNYSVRAGSGRSQNVIAYDPNEDPSLPLVIIGGHYDSVPAGPGANDNASGTATVVEVARELAMSPVPGVAVRYVAFGAEEIGLLGSQHLVNRLSRADRARLKVAMSIDMIAVGAQPAFGGSEPWLSEALARAASQGWRPEDQSGFLRRMSDHAPFLDAGLPAIMFHWVDDPYYHTALDVSGNVQPYSLELMGAIAIELVRVAAR